jgi:nanoRNase/pAp phosphatase (c-di-AMP/oligoRNAs hydrolase)
MDTPQTTLAEKLKAATYVLVTVSRDPSVDQLSAIIGLTLLLNKAGKHAAAVYSGETPSTLQFLKPEDTIEKTTDSLRDFIIALDKSKADKLRYKVEDDVVRIFITPYKTSISERDLEFSQGDFNVDVVVALGVTKQEDLDEAIISHGRILHDATVATVNISAEGDLGSIHWQNRQASSLSEMMTELARLMGSDLIDNQIATALLTGIVAETERFSNEKTTAAVMSASAVLMAAGANQQLIATQLAPPELTPETAPQQPPVDSNSREPSEESSQQSVQEETAQQPKVEQSEPAPDKSDGSIAIDHHDHEEHSSSEPANANNDEPDIATVAEAKDEKPEDYFSLADITANETADLDVSAEQPPAGPAAELENIAPVLEIEAASPKVEHLSGGSKMILEPPALGGQLSANTHSEVLEKSGDPFSKINSEDQAALLKRSVPMATTAASESLPPPPLVAEPVPINIVAPAEQLPVAELPTAAPLTLQPLTVQPPTPTEIVPTAPVWALPADIPNAMPAVAFSDSSTQTLSDLEAAVRSQPETLDAARDEVSRALNADTAQPLPPVEALNAQPMMENLNQAPAPAPSSALPAPEPSTTFADSIQQSIPSLPLPPAVTPFVDSAAMPFDPASFGISSVPGSTVPGMPVPQVIDPYAAPPVPPPIPFNFGTPPPPPQT